MRRLVPAALLLLSLLPGVPAHAATKPLLAVFAGQSNMGGYGTTGADVPSYLDITFSNVFIRRNGAFVPLHPGGDGNNERWGPEAEFAYRWSQANAAQNLYIVKSSTAGSQLENTTVAQAPGTPNADWSPASGELFAGVASSMTQAVAELNASGITDFDTATFWMQGEGDAGSATTAAAYYANLTELVTQARLQWSVHPDAPFILGRITTKWPFAGQVRMAQGRVAAESTTVDMVSTDGFPLAADNKHYTAAGQVLLGGSFFRTFVGTQSGVPVVMNAAASAVTEEQPPNGLTIATVAATNAPNPSATYDFAGGQTDGLAIAPETGSINVTDYTKLAYASGSTRAVTVRATNGVNIATTSLTIQLSKSVTVTRVANTIFRADPADAVYSSIVDGRYTALADTLESGIQLTPAATTRRPAATAGPCGPLAAFSNVDGTADVIGMASPSAAVATDTDIHYTITASVRPSASGTSAGGHIAAITSGASSVKLGVFYDHTTQQFGVAALSAANGTTQSARTTAVFPPGSTYRVRLTRAGTTINLFVNETPAAMSAFPNAISTTVLFPGTPSAKMMLGGAGSLSGSFTGEIGLVRFVRGAPGNGEVQFLNRELTACAG